ncbi:hypothetical protein K435DRAFT_880929 [Dendrothele bispora CBS 962.96]|uniref:Uncharacterized protein n=1 Tax=Dendrothele bispora (strain CBS 962.96) TaxID=1314807 RepID=A0A4S8KIV8_DENBC|nr:hypothetical protein K435DRAFT_880929 [Dendrothele bispora CBS 962.96]
MHSVELLRRLLRPRNTEYRQAMFDMLHPFWVILFNLAESAHMEEWEGEGPHPSHPCMLSTHMWF